MNVTGHHAVYLLCPPDIAWPNWTDNQCHFDWANAFIALCSLYVLLLLIAYLRWAQDRGKQVPSIRRLVFHDTRGILSLILLLCHLLELSDAALSLPSTHVFTVPSSSLALWAASIVLSNVIEKTGRYNFYTITASLWMLNGFGRILRIISLFQADVKFECLRPLTAIAVASICWLLAVFELLDARYEKRRGSLDTPQPNDAANIQYKHDTAHFVSKSTFYWMTPLLRMGFSNPLEMDDLGVLPENHRAKTQLTKFSEIYGKYQGFRVQKPTLLFWKTCWFFIKREFILGGILKLLGDLLQLVGPLGISVIVDYITNPDNTTPRYLTLAQFWYNGWTMAGVVLVASIAQSCCSQACTHLVNVGGIQLNVALQAKIYTKSLRLSKLKSGDDDTENIGDGAGATTHLLSEDTVNVMSAVWIGHYLWAIPFKMALLMYLLYVNLGSAALVGSAVTILTLSPMQLFIGRTMSRNAAELADITDERLQQVSSLIHKMKLLKMLGWTHFFSDKVMEIRRQEQIKLDKDSVCWAAMTFLTHIASIMVTGITLGTHYFVSDEAITANAVFTALALINQLTVTLFIFPVTVPIFIAAWVSGKRLASFFAQPEIDAILSNLERIAGPMTDIHTTRKSFDECMVETAVDSDWTSDLADNVFSLSAVTLTDDIEVAIEEETTNEVLSNADSIRQDDISLSVKGAEFIWPGTSKENCLCLDNVTIEKGKITMIVGKVGSGKTSFLAAILGEMQLVKGSVTWHRKTTIAYAGQTPWLLNGTIRDNITFGRPYIARRYKQVIDACALQPDLDILPLKDLTEIGEKGINLSGGQRQRIGVARTLYSRANFVILDDPLSSLDNAVAMQVFESGIRRLVRRGKRTVLLVTHHLHLLTQSHKVIVMENNRIRIQGQLNDIETLDTTLVANWRESAGRRENSELQGRTARERWQLVKLVASIGLELKQRLDPIWQGEDDVQILSRKPTGRRMPPFSEWNYLSHDLPLTTDECGAVRPCRRQISRKRRHLTRANSLQAHHIRMTPVSRQTSSPLVLGGNRRNRSNRTSSSRSLLRHIARAKSPPPSLAHVHRPIQRMSSTESGFSDANSEVDPDEREDLDVVGGSGDKEERDYGRIPRRVFLAYATAAGLPLAALYLLVTVFWQIARAFTDAWLSVWTGSTDSSDTSYYVAVFSALSVLAVILSICSHGVGQYFGAKARIVLHNKLLHHVVSCHVNVFETMPAGRFMHRFSTDINVIDKKLGTAIQRAVQFLLLCSSALLINTAVTPWFILVAVPVCLFYYSIQRFYRTSSRELQRLESISRSPVVSYLLETISGLPTIRAFGFEEKFTSGFLTKLDLHTNAFLILNSSNRWLGIVLDCLGGLIVYLAIMTALISVRLASDSISGALVGLAISYTLLVPIYLNWVVKFLAECEMYMGAVERIRRMMQLPTEPTSEVEKMRENWPSRGEIKFVDVTLRYGVTREPVIAHLNLNIPGGQKIGICGRTGSGKSTLGLSLFRLVDIAVGKILVDDVDLATLPLNVVRTRIAVVPQDATLLPGSVRINLDPDCHLNDEEIWSALDVVKLRDLVNTQYNGLDGDLCEGAKLSNGERQLFCLARAVVRKSAVLVMDEATSGLDGEAEKMLMSAAEEAFQGKTVILIAHRLSTLLNCNRIVVLERGIIAEDGKPEELMKKPMGLFSTMLRSSEDAP